MTCWRPGGHVRARPEPHACRRSRRGGRCGGHQPQIAPGGSGSFSLYEDDGGAAGKARSTTTKVSHKESGRRHTVSVVPAKGSFRGQAKDRASTLSVKADDAPQRVTASGTHPSAQAYTWDAGW
ncbi:DUF5110 domain-containing protein [Streptomyces sp. NPDC059783]|uniref:DUF5110 domain-containing protein n=1 Tax=Streptomyces sp. NPDC059783 TaxID=3346944 RepID=UPI003659A423